MNEIALSADQNLEDEIELARLHLAQLMRQKWQRTNKEPIDPAPVLHPRIVGDVKLFATREEMISSLPKGGRVMEIGTWAGTFAWEILQRMEPKELHVIDIDFSKFDYAKFGDVIGKRVFIHQGDSQHLLSVIANDSFDFVYVDGDHSYGGARHDIMEALRIVRVGGLVGINDYTTWCACLVMPFGVMKAANEVLNNQGHKIRYIGLHHNGNHDIVVEKGLSGAIDSA